MVCCNLVRQRCLCRHCLRLKLEFLLVCAWCNAKDAKVGFELSLMHRCSIQFQHSFNNEKLNMLADLEIVNAKIRVLVFALD